MHERPEGGAGEFKSASRYELVNRHVDELCPHPAYARHNFSVSPSKLNSLATAGDHAVLDPLLITQENIIIDGYARWQLAKRWGLSTLPCIRYQSTQEDALRRLLETHRRSHSLNDFERVLLALELEPLLKDKARSNQKSGGRNKGSSKLTEVERVDVRSEIAAIAGVSVGNVTKVKQLIETACAELLSALRNREVSIHRAWRWRGKSFAKQRHALMDYRAKRDVTKIIRHLVASHTSKNPATAKNSISTESLGPLDLARRLSRLADLDLGSFVVATVKVPGKGVFITEELRQLLLLGQEESPASCGSKSH